MKKTTILDFKMSSKFVLSDQSIKGLADPVKEIF